NFKTTAPVFIAAAKGANPQACLKSTSKVATAPTVPNNVKAAGPSTPVASQQQHQSQQQTSEQRQAQQQQQQQQTQQPAAPPAPSPLPANPDFPDSTADWAALQKSLGAKGWADLQKAADAAMEETPDNTDDKPPPGV